MLRKGAKARSVQVQSYAKEIALSAQYMLFGVEHLRRRSLWHNFKQGGIDVLKLVGAISTDANP